MDYINVLKVIKVRTKIYPKIGILFFVTLLMVSLVKTSYAATTGPNIFFTGGFELEPLKWTLTDDAIIDDTVLFEGKRSLRIRGKGTAHNAYWEIPAAPGQSMILKVWIKTEEFSGFTPKLTITFKNINKGYMTPNYPTEIVPKYGTNDWELYEEVIPIPEDAYYTFLTIEGKGGEGTLWFDACSIQYMGTDPVPPNPPVNLIGGRVNEHNSYLRWKEPEAASDGEKPVCYKIYRSTSMTNLVSGNNLIADEFFENEYLDRDILAPNKYCYAVASVDLLGNEAISEIIVISSKAPTNLTGNYGFEDLSDKAWTLYKADGKIEYDNECFYEGDYSIKLEQSTIPLNSCQLHYSKIDVKENTDYVITAWVKGKNIVADSGNAGGIVYMQTNQPGPPSAYVTGTFDWTLVYLYFNSGGASFVIPRNYFSKATGTMWIDNYYLSELNQGLSPNIPETINAERLNGTSKVTINWNPPEAIPGVEIVAYKILRSDDPTFSDNSTIKTYSVALETEFTDSDVDPYTAFYYKVVTISSTGTESFPSEAVSVPQMGKVEGFLVEYDDNEELIPVDGASVQIINPDLLETSDSEGKFTIGALLAGDYELEIRKRRYRKQVIPFSIVAGETESLEAIVMEIKTTPPNQVTNITVDADTHIGALLISWDPPSPDPDGEEAVAYNIYKSTDPDFVANEETKFISSIATTSQIDIDVIFGETYYYAITALDDADNESKLPSPIKGAEVKTPPIPNIVAPGSGKIFTDEVPVFQWEKEDVDGYIIELCSEEKFLNNIVEIGRATEEDSSFSTEDFPTGINYWRMRVFYNTGVVGPATEPRKIIFATTNTGLDNLLYVQFEPKVFNPKEVHSAKIQFVLDKEATVTIKAYNIAGRLLDVITTNEPFPAGEHVVEWLGKSNRGEYYKNGLYLVEIVSKDPIDNKSNRYVGRIVINK